MSVGKFKVGDRVKIREDLVKNKSYGGHSIPSLNKSTYLGKEGMITDKLKDIQNTIKSMYIKVGGKIV